MRPLISSAATPYRGFFEYILSLFDDNHMLMQRVVMTLHFLEGWVALSFMEKVVDYDRFAEGLCVLFGGGRESAR